jgi:hypothetical protein
MDFTSDSACQFKFRFISGDSSTDFSLSYSPIAVCSLYSHGLPQGGDLGCISQDDPAIRRFFLFVPSSGSLKTSCVGYELIYHGSTLSRSASPSRRTIPIIHISKLYNIMLTSSTNWLFSGMAVRRIGGFLAWQALRNYKRRMRKQSDSSIKFSFI